MIDSFDFEPGRVLSRKYKIIERLGVGWEGEVYKLEELETGIERAAKFFFPERNQKNKALKFFAKKLHKLRSCSILIHYNTMEEIQFRRQRIFYLVSEYVEGLMLSQYIESRKGKRLDTYQALHLLYELAKGMEEVHRHREYHGDLHTDNVILRRVGLHFDLKLIDLFHWNGASHENIEEDTMKLIQIFHEAIGGSKHYSKQPKEIKQLVCGLKRSLLRKKFRTAGQLRRYLETMTLDSLLEK